MNGILLLQVNSIVITVHDNSEMVLRCWWRGLRHHQKTSNHIKIIEAINELPPEGPL